MTVLVASDKFKGSLTAAQVAAAVTTGIRRVSDVDVVTVPVADGGDGTVDAAVSAGFARVPVTASGRRSRPRMRGAVRPRSSRWPTCRGCGDCARTSGNR